MKVLITSRSFRQQPGEHQRILQQAGCECIESPVNRPLAAEELIPLIRDVDAVIVGLDQVTADVIAAGPRLRVVSKYGVGVDNIDLEAATRAGVVVTNTAGANHTAVAELALGLMLALARSIPQHCADARSGSWRRAIGVELAGKQLGIVGLGRIGEAVARRALAFEMSILYNDVRRRRDLEVQGWIAYADLDELLPRSDVVTLHCPYSPGTAPLIGEAQLRAMKRSGYLINTARAELVDETALTRALREGWIAAAASDVLAHKPPKASPLLAFDSFVATPHIGADTIEATRRMGIMAARNTVLVLQGRRPLALVNPSVYKEKNTP